MAARSMMPRQLPPRQTIWQFMNEFGTAAWRWISRVYMIAGAMIFAATLLGIHVPEWMRLPLGALGFVFGVIIWAIFYLNRPAQSRGNTESL
jgi:hypothetical protein